MNILVSTFLLCTTFVCAINHEGALPSTYESEGVSTIAHLIQHFEQLAHGDQEEHSNQQFDSDSQNCSQESLASSSCSCDSCQNNSGNCDESSDEQCHDMWCEECATSLETIKALRAACHAVVHGHENPQKELQSLPRSITIKSGLATVDDRAVTFQQLRDRQDMCWDD